MAHRKSAAGGNVEDAEKIAVLAAPARIEIATAIQALGGSATVAELAAQLGRPADGLYYHLRAMVKGGLLTEHEGDGGRRYALAVPGGKSLRLRYRPGATANAKAVGLAARSMSRLAQRDFLRALAEPSTVAEGDYRELWSARLSGWLEPGQLAEANRLLRELADLMLSSRPGGKGKLMMVQWMLAPLDARPARREPAVSRRRKGRD